MKKSSQVHRFGFILLLSLFCTPEMNAQLLKKLGKAAERAAERTVQRRVEKETAKRTDQVLDSILEPGKKGSQNQNDETGMQSGDSGMQNGNDMAAMGATEVNSNEENPASMKVYSKFDFVPGDKPLFFDAFEKEFIGDFPSKWNTNGSGEIITLNDSPEKWLELLAGYGVLYIPDVPNLPEEYTIEFDLMAYGLDNKTSSNAKLQIILSDDANFEPGANYAHAWIPFGQYAAFGIRVANVINKSPGGINNKVTADIREAVLNRPHISIAVNKQRYRLWVNEKKYVDIPRMIPSGGVLSTLKFHVDNFKDGKERLFITNVKVNEGGLDLRRTLISEGKVSTNGILFDSGSTNIKPQSMGIIRQISQVLNQEGDMNLKIIGHTDADGDETSNLSLSEKRAQAVVDALVSLYGISSERLVAEGKGESEPLHDNKTEDGKAQNRRVEFIKI